MCDTIERKGVKYSNEIKKEVVDDIMQGKLLIEEAMQRYGVLSQVTIKKWLKEALNRARTSCLEE